MPQSSCIATVVKVDLAPSARLELCDVGFRIPDAVHGDRWMLRHVNLIVEPGETLALVGAAGSGKCLLTALLSRTYDISEGQILLGGRDIRGLSLPALRRSVSTAFEDPSVFSTSVAEDLRLGRAEVPDAEVARAIEIASAQFVYDLPLGLDTRIGEQGMRLSSTQRQRLCLARAIIAAPAVLVIDDALSGLEVSGALRRALDGVTAIVVARRPSTLAMADRVALLENGTVTHIGRHEELAAEVPYYRQLINCTATEFASMTSE